MTITSEERSKIGRASKSRGTRNEHRTMRLLETMGYRCTRSAASLGEWDVIAVGVTDTLLVQVKSNRWPPPAEMAVLREFVCPPGVRKVVHRWDTRKSLPQVMEV